MYFEKLKPNNWKCFDIFCIKVYFKCFYINIFIDIFFIIFLYLCTLQFYWKCYFCPFQYSSNYQIAHILITDETKINYKILYYVLYIALNSRFPIYWITFKYVLKIVKKSNVGRGFENYYNYFFF